MFIDNLESVVNIIKLLVITVKVNTFKYFVHYSSSIYLPTGTGEFLYYI